MKKITALLLALVMLISLCACSSGTGSASPSATAAASPAASGASSSGSGLIKDGTLTVAMECAYAPYNWTQTDDSNGAVPIKGQSGKYANGYDVMMAKKICEANSWKLEIVSLDWNSLVPAVQAGQVDAVIDGQSMTTKRMQQVDFAGPYLYASIVCLTLNNSKFANAKGLSDLSGGTCTSQQGTVWYDSCLPQIKEAKVQTAAEDAPSMLMALESHTVDFVCTDIPTAKGAVAVYPDMKILDFTNGSDNFKVDEGEVDLGISVKKGNSALSGQIDKVLKTMTKDDFDKMLNQAITVQPITKKS